MRSVVLLLSVCLAFGCGDESDPSTNNLAGSTGQGGSTGEAGSSGQGGSAGEDTSMGGSDTSMGGSDTSMGGNDTGMGGSDNSMGGSDTSMGGNDTGMGGEVAFGVCPDPVTFTGQVQMSDGGKPQWGGTPTYEAWGEDYDSGLAAVMAQVPEEGSRDDNTVLDPALTVTGATAIATSYSTDNMTTPRSNTVFWVADGTTSIQLYLDYMDPDTIPPFDIQVGQKISFTVTEVNRYFDNAQISKISDVTLDEVNQDVYLWVPDREMTTEDIGRVVSVTGNLTGTGEECGNRMERCWDVDYGFGRAIFRTTSMFAASGACITYVGPLGFFDGQPQLNVDNFDWLRVY